METLNKNLSGAPPPGPFSEDLHPQHRDLNPETSGEQTENRDPRKSRRKLTLTLPTTYQIVHVNSEGVEEAAYSLHPFTGQPFIVNGCAYSYERSGNKHQVHIFSEGKLMFGGALPKLIHGELHFWPNDRNTVSIYYRNGRPVSISAVKHKEIPKRRSQPV